MIFGNQNNTDILEAFLLAALNLPQDEYEGLTVVDPHLNRESYDGKLSILDVKLRTKRGKTVNIEIQVSDIPEMRERIVFCVSRMVTDQVTKGDNYNTIKRVISILITDYIMFDEDTLYRHRFTLHDPEANTQFTDVVEINTLELPKLPQSGDETELGSWLQFIKAEDEGALEMLAQKNPKIGKAVDLLKEISADERIRLLSEDREKARRMHPGWTGLGLKAERKAERKACLWVLLKAEKKACLWAWLKAKQKACLWVWLKARLKACLWAWLKARLKARLKKRCRLRSKC